MFVFGLIRKALEGARYVSIATGIALDSIGEKSMAKKEIRIPFEELKDPQTVTQRNVKAFRDNGLSIHHNEVDELIDDHSTQQRIYKIRAVKYFGPWRHRG